MAGLTAVKEGIGTEEGDDEGFETATAFEVSAVGFDESLGIAEHFVASHKVAEDVTNKGLAGAVGLGELVNHIDGIGEVAFESGDAHRFEGPRGIDWLGFPLAGSNGIVALEGLQNFLVLFVLRGEV